ncbi:MAG: N-acetylmuramoyl-L-alanine amidase [Akkermansiaceae bacterium]|nr:N-acetylmuramoyl-L-alanine amidase [Akkermansiaceae bacterium]
MTHSSHGRRLSRSPSPNNHRGTSFAGNPQSQYPAASRGSAASSPRSTPPVRTVSSRSPVPRKSPGSLLSEVRVRKDYISPRARGRRNSRSMRPRYITIHSTQNWSRGADAWRHSLALKRSKLGRLSWHYTTDENVAVQHLPTNITGNHADFDGPGNRYSIGIEMCEHPGNSRTKTVERTAKLAAYLMHKHDIPLSRVVPHYHWPRHGMRPANKNCPHFLLDKGRPGSKWRGFQAQVKRYHDDITKGGSRYVSR